MMLDWRNLTLEDSVENSGSVVVVDLEHIVSSQQLFELIVNNLKKNRGDRDLGVPVAGALDPV